MAITVYFSIIMLRTGAVFKIAGEIRRLPAYFDNPVLLILFLINLRNIEGQFMVVF